MRSITVKSSVAKIEDKAFNYCKNAEVIYLPASLQTVGADLFYGCAALTTVRFGGSEEDWNKISFTESSECLKHATVEFNCAA